MSTAEVINYINGIEKENNILKARIIEAEQSRISTERFYNVIISASDVAKMHNVSKGRVLDYAKRNLISKHPNSTDNKLFFRLSEALCWDFDELKRDKNINRVMGKQ